MRMSNEIKELRKEIAILNRKVDRLIIRLLPQYEMIPYRDIPASGKSMYGSSQYGDGAGSDVHG